MTVTRSPANVWAEARLTRKMDAPQWRLRQAVTALTYCPLYSCRVLEPVEKYRVKEILRSIRRFIRRSPRRWSGGILNRPSRLG